MKEGDSLAKVSRAQTTARNELDAANQAKSDAANKREAAEDLAQRAAWNEQSAKQRGDKEAAQFFHQQKKEAQNTAKQAAKEEKEASEKAEKAQKAYDKVSKEQSQAYNDFRDHVDQYNELKEQKQTAEDNRAAAEQKANTTQMALDAQDTLNKHQEDIDKYKETKDTTREKREEKTAYENEQKHYQEESDAWFKAGAEAQRQGNQDLANSFYRKDGYYHDLAVEAGSKAREKENEYQEAKTEMGKAKEQAYGDDAMFDAYTAELKFDNAMNSLKNDPSGDTRNSADNSGAVKPNTSNSTSSSKK